VQRVETGYPERARTTRQTSNIWPPHTISARATRASTLTDVTGSIRGIGKPLAAIFEGRTSGALHGWNSISPLTKRYSGPGAGKQSFGLGNRRKRLFMRGPHGISHTSAGCRDSLGRPGIARRTRPGVCISPGRRTKLPRSPELMRALALHQPETSVWKEASL